MLENAPKEYKEKMFGHLSIAGAPDQFFELQAMHTLALAPHDWAGMSICERGKHVAYLRLKNMADILERHEQLQREELNAFKNKSDQEK